MGESILYTSRGHKNDNFFRNLKQVIRQPLEVEQPVCARILIWLGAQARICGIGPLAPKMSQSKRIVPFQYKRNGDTKTSETSKHCGCNAGVQCLVHLTSEQLHCMSVENRERYFVLPTGKPAPKMLRTIVLAAKAEAAAKW